MAIIYTYPEILPGQVNNNLLFIVSNIDNQKKTRSVSLSNVISFVVKEIEVNDFKLFGKDFCTSPVLQDKDVLMYNAVTDKWCAEELPNSPSVTEIINVDAVYDAVGNVYNGVGVPPPSSYSQTVIYKVVFDVTNTLAASSLNIQSIGNVPLVAPDQSGAMLPIDADFIQPATIYYISYLANTFQISTTPPTPSTSVVEYSNALPVSIAQDVGGVEANNNEDWAPIEDPQGSGIYRGWTLTEIMNRIFYPYQNPAFTNFSMVGQPTTLEVGDTLTGGTRDFTWGFNSYIGNVEPGTLSVNDITNPINTGVTNPLINNASIDPPPVSVNIGNPIAKTVQASHRWQASALTTLDNPAGQQIFNSPVFTVNWYYRWYWGSSANLTLTAGQITALNAESPTNGNFNNKRDFLGNYWYLCIPNGPSGWSGLTNWGTGSTGQYPVLTEPGAPYTNTDSAGFHYAIVSGVQVNGGLGNPIEYRVYRTENIQGPSAGVTIIF